MEKRIPPRTDLEFPYEEDIRSLIEDMEYFETRVTPSDSREVRRVELEKGWQAILYENSENALKNSIDRLRLFLHSQESSYRTSPSYEWGVRAPNGETYRRKGLDITKEEFEGIVENHLQ